MEKEKDELEGPMKEALGNIRLENEKVEKTHKQRSRYFFLNLTIVIMSVKGTFLMLKEI